MSLQLNGELKLVGVEFIILATALPPNSAPEVEGLPMNYIDSPNTVTAYRFRSSNFTSGLGAIVRSAHSSTGTTM